MDSCSNRKSLDDKVESFSHIPELSNLEEDDEDSPWIDDQPITDFDEILDKIETQGKFQKRFLYGLICPISILVALGNCLIFMLYIPDHWCTDPKWNHTTSSYNDWRRAMIPTEISVDGIESFSKCEVYGESNNTKINCPYNNWVYDTKDFTLTIPSQFNWICEREHHVTLVYTIGSAAGLIGRIFVGPLIDKFGRKKIFVWFLVLDSILGLLLLLVPQYFIVFASVFFLMAMMGVRPPSMLLCEIVDSEFRSWISAVEFAAYVIGLAAVPLLAYLLKNWLYIGLAYQIPRSIILISLVLFFYIPESPRWLASMGRVTEAKEIIKRIAKVNNTLNQIDDAELDRQLNQFVIQQREQQVHESNSIFTGFWTLLSKPWVAKNTIALALSVTMSTFIYGGITLNSPYMPGNQFVVFFILAIVELPSSIIGGYMLQTVGRRWTPVPFYFLSAISCIAAAFFPNNMIIVTTAILISKLSVNLIILVTEVQIVEIFPTTLRATGASFTSFICQIIGLSMPSIVNMGRTNESIPYLAFGICSVIGVIASILLPETLHQTLPESLADANSFGKKQPFCSLYPETDIKKRKTKPNIPPLKSIRRIHNEDANSDSAFRRRSTIKKDNTVRSPRPSIARTRLPSTKRRDSTTVVSYVNQIHPTTTCKQRRLSVVSSGSAGGVQVF